MINKQKLMVKISEYGGHRYNQGFYGGKEGPGYDPAQTEALKAYAEIENLLEREEETVWRQHATLDEILKLLKAGVAQ